MVTATEKILISKNEFSDLEDLNCIKMIFEKLKENSLDKKEISCHSICRAFGKSLGIKVETGYYNGGFEHSWLRTKLGNIIDVLPCGIVGGPFLVRKDIALSYKKGRIHNNIINKKQIKFLYKQIEEIMDFKKDIKNVPF